MDPSHTVPVHRHLSQPQNSCLCQGPCAYIRHAWPVFPEHVCPASSWGPVSSFLPRPLACMSLPLLEAFPQLLPHSRDLSQCFADVFLIVGEIHALPALGFPIRKLKWSSELISNSEDKNEKGSGTPQGLGSVAFGKYNLPVALVPGRLLKSLIQNDKMCM